LSLPALLILILAVNSMTTTLNLLSLS